MPLCDKIFIQVILVRLQNTLVKESEKEISQLVDQHEGKPRKNVNGIQQYRRDSHQPDHIYFRENEPRNQSL